jgi:hypothetical protein
MSLPPKKLCSRDQRTQEKTGKLIHRTRRTPSFTKQVYKRQRHPWPSTFDFLVECNIALRRRCSNRRRTRWQSLAVKKAKSFFPPPEKSFVKLTRSKQTQFQPSLTILLQSSIFLRNIPLFGLANAKYILHPNPTLLCPPRQRLLPLLHHRVTRTQSSGSIFMPKLDRLCRPGERNWSDSCIYIKATYGSVCDD